MILTHPFHLARTALAVALDAASETLREAQGVLDRARDSLDVLAARLDPGEGYVPLVTPFLPPTPDDMDFAAQVISIADRTAQP